MIFVPEMFHVPQNVFVNEVHVGVMGGDPLTEGSADYGWKIIRKFEELVGPRIEAISS